MTNYAFGWTDYARLYSGFGSYGPIYYPFTDPTNIGAFFNIGMSSSTTTWPADWLGPAAADWTNNPTSAPTESESYLNDTNIYYDEATLLQLLQTNVDPNIPDGTYGDPGSENFVGGNTSGTYILQLPGWWPGTARPYHERRRHLDPQRR